MPITEQSKQNETAQGSLFAGESLSQFAPSLGPIHQFLGVPKTERRLEHIAQEFRSLSRSTDPLTSKKAGEKTKEFRARHISKIWGCLKENGPKTYKEIALLIGMEPVAVARRRKEMEENQLIEVLNETRDGCALWKAK